MKKLILLICLFTLFGHAFASELSYRASTKLECVEGLLYQFIPHGQYIQDLNANPSHPDDEFNFSLYEGENSYYGWVKVKMRQEDPDNYSCSLPEISCNILASNYVFYVLRTADENAQVVRRISTFSSHQCASRPRFY